MKRAAAATAAAFLLATLVWIVVAGTLDPPWSDGLALTTAGLMLLGAGSLEELRRRRALTRRAREAAPAEPRRATA